MFNTRRSFDEAEDDRADDKRESSSAPCSLPPSCNVERPPDSELKGAGADPIETVPRTDPLREWLSQRSAEETERLQRLYALGALTASDSIARQERYLKTVMDASKAAVPVKRFVSVVDRGSLTSRSTLTSKTSRSARSPKTPSTPPPEQVARMGSREVAILWHMSDLQKRGNGNPTMGRRHAWPVQRGSEQPMCRKFETFDVTAECGM